MGKAKLKCVLISLFLLVLFSNEARSQTNTTVNEFWPAVKLNFDLPKGLRLQLIAERHDGEGEKKLQSKFGALVSFRMKRIAKNLLEGVDSEEGYYVTVGVGYERLQPSAENRLVIQATPRHMPGAGILITDRSRLEFRWLKSSYDFRYRNKLSVQRTFKIEKFRLTPHAYGEIYWARNLHAFNQNEYGFGVQIPYKHRFMVDTYLQRQNCNTCKQERVKVLGLSLNIFLGKKEK
jgi:hypothetical protein